MHENVEGERTIPEVVGTGKECQGAIPASDTGFPARLPGGGEVRAPVPAARASEQPIARGGAKGDRVHFEAESYEEEDLEDKGSGAKSGGGNPNSVLRTCVIVSRGAAGI